MNIIERVAELPMALMNEIHYLFIGFAVAALLMGDIRSVVVAMAGMVMALALRNMRHKRDQLAREAEYERWP